MRGPLVRRVSREIHMDDSAAIVRQDDEAVERVVSENTADLPQPVVSEYGADLALARIRDRDAISAVRRASESAGVRTPVSVFCGLRTSSSARPSGHAAVAA